LYWKLIFLITGLGKLILQCFLTIASLVLSIRAPGGQVKTKGTIYLSNVRMVFVPNKPVGNFFAFDMPLVSNASLKVGSLYLLT
jgi:hypothetical protein